MKRQQTHADWALLPMGQFSERTKIQFRANIELPFSFVKFLLDELAFFFMLFPVLVLTFLVTIPYALAGPALHEGITLFPACRTHLGRSLVTFGFILAFFNRFAK